MVEITTLKNDINTFISEKSSFYSISEAKIIEVFQALFFEKEFIQALNQAKYDDGIIVNEKSSEKIIENLKLTNI